MSNTARKIDNSVARVGSFLQPIAKIINPSLGDLVNRGVNGVHQVRNSLEKSMRTPMRDIQKDIYN